MANRIVWTPSTDANVASYDIEIAASLAGAWSLLVNVAHNLNGPNYDAGGFFYLDAVSAADSWYRVTVIDAAGQRSAPSTPFQALMDGGLALAALSDLKEYLSRADTNTTDDALLTRLLISVSGAFESLTGRKFAVATYTDTRNGNGSNRIIPKHYPVQSITSLTVDGTAITQAVGTGTGWVFAEDSVWLRGYRLSEGYGNVVLTYTAGYPTIPAEVAQAVIELTAMKYRERAHVGNASQSNTVGSVSFLPSIIPQAVSVVVDAYRRISF
jgi:uncharacterized phiE125 gp8 family phage protein